MNSFTGKWITVSSGGGVAASRNMRLKGGRRVILRAAGPGDAPAVQQFIRGLSLRSRRNRFFSPLRELSPHQLEGITQMRPAAGLALVGVTADASEPRIVAMAQYVVCSPLDAEFAMVVDDAWQRQGLGNEMFGLLAEHAARAGLASFSGFVLPENEAMLALLARINCEFVVDADPDAIHVIKRFDVHERIRARQAESSCHPQAVEPALRGNAACEFLESVAS